MSRRAPWPPAAKVTVAALAAVLVGLAVWSGNRQNTTVTHAGTVTTTSAPAATPGSAATSSTSAAVTTTATEPPVSSTTSTTSPEPSTSASGPAAAPRAADRPDPALTPGVADPAVTQANIHSTICVSGYSSSVRSVPQSEKDRVYAEYGITSHPTGAYEVDHLISLELGGSNDIGNLWPEPYSGPNNSRDKDVLENRFHDEVCSGQITLAQGQYEIVHWWMFE